MIFDEENITFADRILQLLKPMSDLSISKGEHTQYLLKDNMIFAKIIEIENRIYLRTSGANGYIAIDQDAINDKDAFLIQATKAYWLVKEESENFATTS
ncbi:MAG: hypothetical protein HRU35_02170 [Rickettsiaceae bacterium]|nr:hypothetical protein [Rickettsiaceae bacterium]